MNQITNNTENNSAEKSKAGKKEVRKKSKMENQSLMLVDILKGLDEIKSYGFGRVVIIVQNGHIYCWEQIKTKTDRNLTSSDD